MREDLKTSVSEIRGALRDERASSGLTVAGMRCFPAPLKVFLAWVMSERAVTCERAAGFLDATEEEARSLITELTGRGLIEHVPTCGIPVYRVCLRPCRLKVPVELLDELIAGCRP